MVDRLNCRCSSLNCRCSSMNLSSRAGRSNRSSVSSRDLRASAQVGCSRRIRAKSSMVFIVVMGQLYPTIPLAKSKIPERRHPMLEEPQLNGRIASVINKIANSVGWMAREELRGALRGRKPSRTS